MAKFKFGKYGKLEDVPEAYRGLYAEKDGQFVVDYAKLEEFEFDDREELAGALENERKERKRLREEFKKFEGIDPERAREAQKKLEDLEDEKLTKKGDYDRLLAKRQAEFDAKEAELKKQLEARDSQLTKFKLTDKVREAAIKAGVIAEDIDDVLTLTSRRFKLGDKDSIVVLDRDGDESTLTLDKFFGEEFKTQKPKFYGASGTGGSGAPAGAAQGGTGGATSVKRDDFAKLSAAEQSKMAKTGVQIVD